MKVDAPAFTPRYPTLDENPKYPTYLTTEGEQPMKGRPNYYIGLRTIPVILRNGNHQIKVNALLDDGSTKSYINSNVAAQLRLCGRMEKVTVTVLNGNTEVFETMPVSFDIIGLNGKVTKQISAFTTDNVTGDLQTIDWNKYANKWEHLNGIRFYPVPENTKIDILIGLDYSDLHYSYRDVRGRPGEPIARLTPLGWTCTGDPIPVTDNVVRTNFMATFFTEQLSTENIDQVMRKFWEVEELPQTKIQMSPAETAALSSVNQSLNYKNGMYTVRIPWKNADIALPNNYNTAFQRLVNTEKRLLKNATVADSYNKSIQQYLEKGYIQKVQEPDLKLDKKWFLPHFAIIKPEKATTKTRIVFDASTKSNGISLNDVIHQGPKLQQDLFEVLLRFRRNPVAIVCDIAEMYLRIGVAPEDRTFQRFLWRWLDTTKTPCQYQFNRVVFGMNSSPFIAQYVTQKHAKDNAEKWPLAAETVLKSTYMDDSMDSVLDEENGIKLYQQLSELWAAAGMHARKWLSNSEIVLEHIPENDRAQHVDLDQGYLPTIKTLGVMWIASEDNFTFQATTPPVNFVLTKRTFLQKIASLFDPTGFLSPFVVRAKMLLQETWTTGMDWNDQLPDELDHKGRRWFQELEEISSIKVPRCLRQAAEYKTVALHMFADASELAYGAVVYIMYEYEDGTSTRNIVASKSRVAPLNVISIPRLELMAAVLGLRLIKSIVKVLEIPMNQVVCWSDSMNVLWWIRGQGRTFKPFVGNRIGEIHSQTNPDQWRHVPTKMNPADLLSRGTTIKNLCQNTLWWKGPEFLGLDKTEWPETNIKTDDRAFAEVKSTKRNVLDTASEKDKLFSLFINDKKRDDNWRLNPTRFSSWMRLKRVQAWVYRFVNNCRLPKYERVYQPLLPEEIAEAEKDIIAQIQQETFSDEYHALIKEKSLPSNSKILIMKPRLDENGLIRSDGRLKHAKYLAYDVRYPILLPRKTWVTKLIVKYFHELGNHVCGTNETLARISSKYWIISGREEIREWEAECYACRRRKAKVATQIMAPLPAIRLNLPLRAFAQTGVDFAGPFLTKQGRGRVRHKRYLALFTCLKTRAVHLEIAFGLDTNSFLNAFNRMINRRGMPTEMLSDNGTNFKSANKELQGLISKLDIDKIQSISANRGIKWTFNPPLSPHFGGVFEVMIKAAKKAIFAILNSADITDEELITAFTGAEALINSRPLTYQSANPLDDTPLTPNHFLHGQLGGQFAPEAVDVDYNPRKRWRRVQELISHFWHRWMREWLPGLNVRKKWNQTKKDFQVNDIVLVMSTDTPRGNWPMAKVIEVFRGDDDHVRVCKIQVGKNVFTRSISKLCPLEIICDK